VEASCKNGKEVLNFIKMLGNFLVVAQLVASEKGLVQKDSSLLTVDKRWDMFLSFLFSNFSVVCTKRASVSKRDVSFITQKVLNVLSRGKRSETRP
jgi:hypothetical protein